VGKGTTKVDLKGVTIPFATFTMYRTCGEDWERRQKNKRGQLKYQAKSSKNVHAARKGAVTPQHGELAKIGRACEKKKKKPPCKQGTSRKKSDDAFLCGGAGGKRGKKEKKERSVKTEQQRYRIGGGSIGPWKRTRKQKR